MSEVNPRDFGAYAGLSYLDKEPLTRPPFGWKGDIGRSYGIRIDAKLSYTAYVVKSGSKERYAKTKEKALQIASEMLDCDGKVEIKRIELN